MAGPRRLGSGATEVIGRGRYRRRAVERGRPFIGGLLSQKFRGRRKKCDERRGQRGVITRRGRRGQRGASVLLRGLDRMTEFARMVAIEGVAERRRDILLLHVAHEHAGPCDRLEQGQMHLKDAQKARREHAANDFMEDAPHDPQLRHGRVKVNAGRGHNPGLQLSVVFG